MRKGGLGGLDGAVEDRGILKASPTLVISNTTKKGILTSKEKALTGEDILLIGMMKAERVEDEGLG